MRAGKGSIDGEKAVINGNAIVITNNLMQGNSAQHFLKQQAILFFACLQGLLHLFAFGNVFKGNAHMVLRQGKRSDGINTMFNPRIAIFNFAKFQCLAGTDYVGIELRHTQPAAIREIFVNRPA